MAPRGQTLPQAATESAREARKSFFCELCQKGYARMNDFEAHEGSYDHQHRKRLKEMKQLTKDPNASSKAERERKANEEAGLKSINLSLSSGNNSSSTKKKPVFKSTLQPHNATAVGQTVAPPTASANDDVEMADSNGDGEAWLKACAKLATGPVQLSQPDRYDPRLAGRLNPCPFPQCGDESCRHTKGIPSRDPRRTLEILLRQGGFPTKESNESWGDFGHRKMVKDVHELQGKGVETHGHVLSYMRENGMPTNG